MIDHREALALAAAQVDWPLSPDEEADLRDHLTRCASCRTAAAAIATDAARLKRLPRRDAPGRVGNVVRAAATGRPRSSSRLHLVLATSLLLAATALGGLFAVGALVSRREPPPTPRTAVSPAVPTPTPTALSTPAPATPPPSPPAATPGAGAGSGFAARAGERWVRVAGERSLGAGAAIQAFGSAPGFGVVAVGTSGTNAGAWVSRDGRRWRRATRIEGARGARMIAVGVAANRAVAIGTAGDGRAAVWISRDGLRWTRDIPPEFNQTTIRVVAVGPRGIVVGGDAETPPRAGRLWFSTNGTRWEPTIDVDFVRDVTAGPRGFAAVGCDRTFARCSTSRAWSSPDGKFWKNAHIQAPPSDGLLRVVAMASGFVSFAREPIGSGQTVLRVWTSTTGETWRPLGTPSQLAGARSRGLAASRGPGVLTLTDGVSGRSTLELWTSDGSGWEYVQSRVSFEAIPRAIVTPSGAVLIEVRTASGPNFWITPAEASR